MGRLSICAHPVINNQDAFVIGTDFKGTVLKKKEPVTYTQSF
jgi:hypothetical protein